MVTCRFLLEPGSWQPWLKSILPEIELFQVTGVPTGITKNTSREEKPQGQERAGVWAEGRQKPPFPAGGRKPRNRLR